MKQALAFWFCFSFVRLATAQQDLRYPLSDIEHQPGIFKANKVRTAALYRDSTYQVPSAVYTYDREGRLVHCTSGFIQDSLMAIWKTFAYDSAGRLTRELGYCIFWSDAYYMQKYLQQDSTFDFSQSDTMHSVLEYRYNAAGEMVYEYRANTEKQNRLMERYYDKNRKSWHYTYTSQAPNMEEMVIKYYLRTDSTEGSSREVEIYEDGTVSRSCIRTYDARGELSGEYKYDHSFRWLGDSVLTKGRRYVYRNLEGRTLLEEKTYDLPLKKRKPGKVNRHCQRIYNNQGDEIIYTDYNSEGHLQQSLFYRYEYTPGGLLQKMVETEGKTGKTFLVHQIKYTYWE